MLAREIGQYKESADTYAGLSEYVTPAETDGEKENAEAPEGTGASSVSLPTVDFESLLAQGPDVKAWLELPGTVIQYPVAQCEDNSYYLKHLYDGTANKVGCLFIDYENAEDFPTTTRSSMGTTCGTAPCSPRWWNTKRRLTMTNTRKCTW